jgi:hypothetical protein
MEQLPSKPSEQPLCPPTTAPTAQPEFESSREPSSQPIETLSSRSSLRPSVASLREAVVSSTRAIQQTAFRDTVPSTDAALQHGPDTCFITSCRR